MEAVAGSKYKYSPLYVLSVSSDEPSDSDDDGGDPDQKVPL